MIDGSEERVRGRDKPVRDGEAAEGTGDAIGIELLFVWAFVRQVDLPLVPEYYVVF